MTSNEEKEKTWRSKLRVSAFGVEMRKGYIKVPLTVLAALLTFGGPTYLIYVLRKFLSYTLLVPLGLASFTAGLILFLYLLGEEGKAKAST